jgi:hypothetical protein
MNDAWRPLSSVCKAHFVTARAISMKLGVMIPLYNMLPGGHLENQTFKKRKINIYFSCGLINRKACFYSVSVVTVTTEIQKMFDAP